MSQPPAKYDTATPYLAAYVLLRDGDKVAMVLRSHTKWMDGYWGMLSGKVEWKESFTQAAIREAKEEGGVTIKAEDAVLKLIAQRHSEDSDWVDAIFEVTTWEGEIHNAEPHIHEKLDWFPLNAIPENTIPAVKMYLEAIAAGKTYIEINWDN